MRAFLSLIAVWAALGCSEPRRPEPLAGPVELVVLHSADTHSQLFPWTTLIGAADARRGLGATGELAGVGGFARLATLIGRERAAARRVLVLDSGDLFQGSLAFERFGGEPEVLAFDALGVDAQALGNHELDHGSAPVRERYGELAAFPLLAANYRPEIVSGQGLSGVVEPFVVLDAAGLRVGVIGVGNTTSAGALRSRPNELESAALAAGGAVQGAIDFLRPVVDLVVAVTHLGLNGDEALVRATSGLDAVLGGHQHIALDEPEWVTDCGAGEGLVRDAWGRERSCVPRSVPIVHSGAYGKFLGKLTFELDADPATFGPDYDPLDRYEVVTLGFELLPVNAQVPEDPALELLLEPFRADGFAAWSSPPGLGFAPLPVERNGITGGDSPLGNFAAEAVRHFAATELAVLGASSLRHDLPPGVIDAETLARVAPFDDPLVRVPISGAALARAFEHAARSAAARDCRTQLHVAGLVVRFRCPCSGEQCARVYPSETDQPCRTDADCAAFGGLCHAERCFAPLVPEASYELATTAYLASGGSGLFDPIPAARRAAGDGLHEVLAEHLRDLSPCPADACAEAGAAADARCSTLPCLDATSAHRDGRIRFEAP